MSLIKRFEKNTLGQDFSVGDIHGNFTALQSALDAAGFNPEADRLFACGDLVDRGPECRESLAWLDKPWFHSVRGNHDDYVVRFDTCDIENWIYNGGSWFAGLNRDEQEEFRAQFAEMPIAIEVETDAGLVGIVHADCPFSSWFELQYELAGPNGSARLKLVKNTCMWSRSRIEQQELHGVEDVRAVVCGHSPVKSPVVLGNVYHIDTAGWMPGRGYFTLLNLGTLQAIPAIKESLQW